VPTDALAAITEGLGKEWIGDTALFKLYPCAHVIHPFIEAAIQNRSALDPPAAGIKRVVCRIPPWAMPIVAVPRETKITPRNDLEAIASLPFMVAAGFIDGRVDLETLKPETIARQDIVQLAARIECEPDAALTVGFDGTMEIEIEDGERRSVPAILPVATPERVRAKFRANAKLGGMTRVKEIEQLLESRTSSLQDLMQAAVLRQAGRKS
jgi:2-methylcitrate dehydratase PrpD